MNYLRDLGISSETITKIKEYNDEDLIYNFLFQKENTIKLIKFLKKIGVTVIDKLLIYRLEFFTKDYDEILKSFDQYEQKVLVELINEDINAINFI